jgi:uncharacterized protein YceK
MKIIGAMIVFAALLLSTTGCGTVMYRGGDNFFGAYPYQCTVLDAAMCGSTETVGAGLPSIPFDFILDTVFLPFDLVFWMTGQHKDFFLPETW